MKHPKPLKTLYHRGHSFRRVTVIRGYRGFAQGGQAESWLVVGPGINWLGQPFADFEQAITFATYHALKVAATRGRRVHPPVV